MTTKISGALCAFTLSTGIVLHVMATDVVAQQAAQPQPTTGGYADPAGIPARPRTPDIEPVYRGPLIDTLATIRQRGVLRVGVAAVEPMVMRDADGKLSGFSIDLATRLAEDLGVRVEFFETSWSQVIADLLDRHFDVIASGLWITPDRALVVNFSDPTSIEGIHLVANKALTAGMTTRDAYNRADVRLSVYPGTLQAGVASRLFPKATLVPVEPDDHELTTVLAGKAHAAIVATFAPLTLVAKAPDTLVLPLAESLQTTRTAMAIRKGDADFLNFLDSWLAFQRDGGWLDERIRHWAEQATK